MLRNLNENTGFHVHSYFKDAGATQGTQRGRNRGIRKELEEPVPLPLSFSPYAASLFVYLILHRLPSSAVRMYLNNSRATSRS